MGAHDYRCSVCVTPATYQCGEPSGEECKQTGIGSDEAMLDLFFFDAADAPEGAEEFEDARGRARRVETRPFAYDWGEYEFTPSLNYLNVVMNDEEDPGIWVIRPFDGDEDESHPVELDIPENERVWVVTYCTPCHALFAARETPEEEPCREYLSQVAQGLRLDFAPDSGRAAKAAFIEQVRERVARRRPTPKQAALG